MKWRIIYFVENIFWWIVSFWWSWSVRIVLLSDYKVRVVRYELRFIKFVKF